MGQWSVCSQVLLLPLGSTGVGGRGGGGGHSRQQKASHFRLGPMGVPSLPSRPLCTAPVQQHYRSAPEPRCHFSQKHMTGVCRHGAGHFQPLPQRSCRACPHPPPAQVARSPPPPTLVTPAVPALLYPTRPPQEDGRIRAAAHKRCVVTPPDFAAAVGPWSRQCSGPTNSAAARQPVHRRGPCQGCGQQHPRVRGCPKDILGASMSQWGGSRHWAYVHMGV